MRQRSTSSAVFRPSSSKPRRLQVHGEPRGDHLILGADLARLPRPQDHHALVVHRDLVGGGFQVAQAGHEDPRPPHRRRQHLREGRDVEEGAGVPSGRRRARTARRSARASSEPSRRVRDHEGVLDPRVDPGRLPRRRGGEDAPALGEGGDDRRRREQHVHAHDRVVARSSARRSPAGRRFARSVSPSWPLFPRRRRVPCGSPYFQLTPYDNDAVARPPTTFSKPSVWLRSQ